MKTSLLKNKAQLGGPSVCLIVIIALVFAFPLATVAVVAAATIIVLLISLLQKRRDKSRGWRARRLGRDEIIYEELVRGSWRRITVCGELLTSRKPKFLVYCTPIHIWQDYPDWARARRKEIFDRIKSELREPHYKYVETDSP